MALQRREAMRIGICLGTAILLLVTSISSQVFQDPFNYRPGPLGHPWTPDVGSWTATGSAVHTAPTGSLQYATLPMVYLQDCVAECVVTYNPKGLTTNTQRGGVVLRVKDAKKQDLWIAQVFNGSLPVQNFNCVQIWEQTSRGFGQGIGRNISRGRLRFTMVDRRMRAELDWDLDGRWDFALTESVWSILPVQQGMVGLFGAGGAFIDDFKLFDAVLIESPSAPPSPRPGVVVPLALRGFPSGFYVAAAAFGNEGFPLGPGRVPLRFDPLFIASAAGGLSPIVRNARGQLDARGDGSLWVAIPGNPAVVGFTVYVAFIVHDGVKTILNYSNDYEITVQP